MTAAYDLFLREFNATGRESMDGVSVYNLAHLSEPERLLVHETLLQAFQQRHARAPRPLAFITPNTCTRQLLEEVLQAQAPQETSDEFVLNCAYALLSITVHPAAMDILERKVLANDDPWLCGLAMEGLTRSVPGTDASERLARIVCADATEAPRLGAADALLMRHGWRLEDAQRKVETLTLMRAMIGGDAAAQDAALLKVLKTPVQTWPRP
jgi:hypothetical protein